MSSVIAGVADLYIGLGCGYMEVLFLFYMDRTVAIELENSVEIDTVYIPYFPGKPFHTVLDDPIVVYGERRMW